MTLAGHMSVGQLTLAKAAADNPATYAIDVLQDAKGYLERLRSNGGVRNSERAQARLERRIAALSTEIATRTALHQIIRGLR